jgi:dolichol-phosphate mannosyltransferase
MDNHSTDGSFEVAKRLAAEDPEIRVIRLSRNFGYQANILTGLLSCKGDAAIQLDADGEDDPALIPAFVREWEKGTQVVYGVRKQRVEGILRQLERKIYYRVVRAISTVPIPVDAGDFRLLDRKVLEALRLFPESNPYLRGIIAYSGFSQVGIDYSRRARFAGESKFSTWDLIRFAWDGITSFSRKPLMIASWSGFALSTLSFVGALFYGFFHFVVGTKLPGFTTLVLIQLFLAGVQLLCIGVLGAYLARIFDEVKARPRSIVEREISPGQGGDTGRQDRVA